MFNRTIGPGVAAKMLEQGDVPLSDEQYVGGNMSFAFGEKGIYVYSKDANRTYFSSAVDGAGPTELDPNARFLALSGAHDLRGKLPLRAGADPYPRRDLGEIKWFVAHHTGAGPYRPTVYDTAAYQTSPGAHLDFPGFAYTAYVEADGTLYLCNDMHTVSWANGVGSPSVKQGVGIYNWYTFSCCFAGDDPTEAQILALARARKAAETVLGRKLAVFGHRQVSGGTECPGAAMRMWLPRLIEQ